MILLQVKLFSTLFKSEGFLIIDESKFSCLYILIKGKCCPNHNLLFQSSLPPFSKPKNLSMKAPKL